MARRPAPYGPLAPFVRPAEERCELWRTAAGLVLTFVAGLALYQLALAVLAGAVGPETMQALMDETTFSGATPRATYLTLFSFVFFGTGLAMALRALHARGLASLFGAWEAALSDFLRVVLACGTLYAGLLILLPEGYDMVRNEAMPLGLWFALLPLSLAAIGLQAGVEELIFRGYLQQQLAARLRAWPVWMLVPALLFGAAHWSPGAAGGNAVLYALWAVAFGIAAADLTARTGALGAAIGLHFANNAFAVLGTALTGPGSGLALYHVPMTADAPELATLMPVELGTLFVAWLAARLALKV